MSSPKVISWLPLNPTLIAPTQALTAAGNLQLNSRVTNLPQGNFIYDKVIRRVSLVSTGNTAATFTITGIGSPTVNGDGTGNPTQVLGLIDPPETIVGLVANIPKYSVNIYSQIISISVSAPIANISAGSGPDGITDFVFLNTNSVIGLAKCSLQFLNNATMTATAYISLNKPQIIDQNAGNLINSPFLDSEFIASGNVNTITTIPTPCSVVWLSVETTTVDSLNFTVLQQGVYP